jgi:hypothetical protein
MLSSETEIPETNLSDHFGQLLTLYEDKFPEISSKLRKTIVKYRQENNEVNIQYLNFLLSKDWLNIYRQHVVNIPDNEFIHVFTYYLDIAVPFKKVKVNEQKKKSRITSGIRKSSERLKFLNRFD